MGWFDKDDKGMFGGMFDFNGDGKTTWDEELLGFQLLREYAKKQENNSASNSASDFKNNSESHFHNDFEPDVFNDTDDSDKYEWRLYCEDGFEFGIDPEDYETEEDYEEALNEAKYEWRDNCESVLDTGVDPEDYETEDEYLEALEEERIAWRDTCEAGTDYGIEPTDYETEEEYEEALAEAQEEISDAGITLNFSVECPALEKLDEIKEEDYPNKRRYNAAYTLANEFLIYFDSNYEKKEKARCRFIRDNADTILAANYLSHNRGFLYAQAIKDNFSIPCSLPDEDESREMEFSDVLCKIAKRDVPLSFEVWSWCLEQFLPYAEYDDSCGNDLSVKVIDNLYCFPDGYKTKLVQYMSDNDCFSESVMMSSDEPANSISEVIAEAVKQKLFKTANILFKDGLEKAGEDWKGVNALTEGVILGCKNYEELESMEYFRDNLLPIVKAIPLGMVQDEIAEWEKDIAEYINRVEDECEQYAFTRKNAWRKTVPNGKKYGLDPLYYHTEQEYLEALNDKKYGWRKWYKNRENYGLNPDRFETQEEYREALNDKAKEARQQERDKRLKEQQLNEEAKMQEYESDKTIYTYCGVLLPFSSRPYSFRTEDYSIKIGDAVIVPVGEDKKEMKGKVVSVGQYSRLGVPYPVEKTKFILRKVDNETE